MICKHWDSGWCYKKDTKYCGGCVGSDNCDYIMKEEAKEKLAKFGALVLSKGIFNMAPDEFLKLEDPGIKEAVEESLK